MIRQSPPVRLVLLLPQATFAALEQVAEREHLKPSQLARRVVAQAVEREMQDLPQPMAQ